jgi:nucleoside-diphosphate-sugar epimerase
MNILIIGAGGFIGSYCMEHFSAAGHNVTGVGISDKNTSRITERFLLSEATSTVYSQNISLIAASTLPVQQTLLIHLLIPRRILS